MIFTETNGLHESPAQVSGEERLGVTQRRAEFLNRIAHDLKSPLTTAMLMADLIGLDDTDAEQRREYLEVLMQQLRREQEILEQLLVATRVEVGEIMLDPRPLDFGAVVAKAIESVRESAQAKNIDFGYEKPHQLPEVIGDFDFLSGAVSEVLGNAVFFTPGEGRIQISWVVSDEEVAVVIRDTGPGFDPENLEFLFEPYFQGAGPSLAHSGRPGLGLFVVRRVLEGLGGRILAKSVPQGGAQFEMYLPVTCSKTES